VHAVVAFDVPRPRALLGQMHMDRLLSFLRETIELHPPGGFATFRLSAAGADSPILNRLGDAIGTALALERVASAGHLLAALRRGPAGWELLVRLTPRPLSARQWRLCNLPGALDATIAHAMVRLARPRPEERFVNLACGSGTLLVERLALGPAAAMSGVDLDPAALACAARNLAASGARAQLAQADLSALPLPAASYDTAAVDLPYGMLMGHPIDNRRTYRAALREGARVVRSGGQLVAITASWRLFEALLAEHATTWQLVSRLRLRVPSARGELRPVVYLLRRTERDVPAGNL
jgi:23S rRNA G2445 N2-methylase RlmL